MNNLLTSSRKNKHSIWFYCQLFTLVLLLILAIYFRFTNLGEKIFWVDEISTITRVAGYSKPEIITDLISRNIVDINTLDRYQRLDRGRTFADTLKVLQASPEPG